MLIHAVGLSETSTPPTVQSRRFFNEPRHRTRVLRGGEQDCGCAGDAMSKLGHRGWQRVMVIVGIEEGEQAHPVVAIGHDIVRQQ